MGRTRKAPPTLTAPARRGVARIRETLDGVRAARAWGFDFDPEMTRWVAGGWHPTYAKGQLTRAMERVAMMTDEDRERFRLLPPPAPRGHPQREALELRGRGVSYDVIAETLGQSEATIRQWVHRQLEKATGEEVRSVDVARFLQLHRLDRLMEAQWPKAEAGSTDAATTVLKIMERQSKLLGLDAPIKINVEDRIREIAIAEGIDPDEALEEARSILKGRDR